MTNSSAATLAEPRVAEQPQADTAQLPAVAEQRQRLVVHDDSSFSNYLDTAKFEQLWRVARAFANSGLVPKHLTGNEAGCFILLQMSMRLEVDPFMFMQNTYMSPDGKPALYGQMAIALINSRGPFTGPIQFQLTGESDTRKCRAFAKHKITGDICDIDVDIAMAKSEGWYSRNKKWQSIPDLMLRYRSGAWLGRVYAPETLMGMPTMEELEDTATLTLVGTGKPGAPYAVEGVQPIVPEKAKAAMRPVEAKKDPASVEPRKSEASAEKQQAQAAPQPQPPHDPETGEIHGDDSQGGADETLFSE